MSQPTPGQLLWVRWIKEEHPVFGVHNTKFHLIKEGGKETLCGRELGRKPFFILSPEKRDRCLTCVHHFNGNSNTLGEVQ